jgi:hypothetical protein
MDANSVGLIPLGSGDASSSTVAGDLHASGPATTTSFPDDLDIDTVPPEPKKDWFAIFNPKVKRVLDVSLVHTLKHERCVFCSF